MLKKILGLMLLIWAPLLFAGHTIPENELPFGVWLLHRSAEDCSNLDDVRDSLGFNFVYYASDDSLIESLANYNLKVIFRPLYAGDPELGDNFLNYERSHYLKIEAEENSDTVRFLTKGGVDDCDWFIPDNDSSGTRITALDNLTYRTVRNYIHTTDEITYETFWRMLIEDSESIADTLTVAIFTAFYENSPIDSSIITGSQFTGDTMEISCFSYQMPDDGKIRFKLDTFNNCDLKIDWFKVYNNEGRNCVELNAYDEAIADYVDTPLFADTVMNWYMRDEPYVDNIQPLVHIAKVIRNSTASAFTDTTYEIVTMAGGDANLDATRYLLEQSSKYMSYPAPVIFKCMYPFAGQYRDTLCNYRCITSYYGWDTVTTDHNLGLQTKFTYEIIWPAEHLHRVLGDSVQWWMIAQAWEQYYTDCGNQGSWRYPTRSELSCEVFMGLSYGARGIAFYTYDGTSNATTIYNGIRDANMNTSHIWDKLHDDINPYIKAIDEYYMPLEWVEAGYTDTSDHNPDVDIINTIDVFSNDPDSASPDLGWMHVGVFQDDSYDYYFMLVNRACSKDEYGNEAGSVTATIWLNRNAVGSDFVRIIDIAKTVKRDDNNNWIGIPDTAKTGIAQNGAIPYVTVLRAGEGRLYKIIPVLN